MESVNRRAAIKAAGAVAIGATLSSSVVADEPKGPKRWTLEGELKVHPKYLYRYYLVLGNGQICALYGADHSREPDSLARIQLPGRVRVRGTLGTDHYTGGTKDNPSPFPATWLVYMDVSEVELLK